MQEPNLTPDNTQEYFYMYTHANSLPIHLSHTDYKWPGSGFLTWTKLIALGAHLEELQTTLAYE